MLRNGKFNTLIISSLFSATLIYQYRPYANPDFICIAHKHVWWIGRKIKMTKFIFRHAQTWIPGAEWSSKQWLNFNSETNYCLYWIVKVSVYVRLKYSYKLSNISTNSAYRYIIKLKIKSALKWVTQPEFERNIRRVCVNLDQYNLDPHFFWLFTTLWMNFTSPDYMQMKHSFVISSVCVRWHKRARCLLGEKGFVLLWFPLFFLVARKKGESSAHRWEGIASCTLPDYYHKAPCE